MAVAAAILGAAVEEGLDCMDIAAAAVVGKESVAESLGRMNAADCRHNHTTAPVRLEVLCYRILFANPGTPHLAAPGPCCHWERHRVRL